MRRITLSLGAGVVLASSLFASLPAWAAPVDEKAVATHFAAVGLAKFEDAAKAAEALDAAINAFLAAPSEEGLTKAREAWKAARRSQLPPVQAFRS